MRSLLLFGMAISVILSSCCKEDLQDEIVGRWRIIERYNGYYNGGNFLWNPIPNEFQLVYEFTSDFTFLEYRPNDEIRCTGTYEVVSKNIIHINTDCYVDQIAWNISLDNEAMYITHMVDEGQIIEKFQKEQ